MSKTKIIDIKKGLEVSHWEYLLVHLARGLDTENMQLIKTIQDVENRIKAVVAGITKDYDQPTQKQLNNHYVRMLFRYIDKALKIRTAYGCQANYTVDGNESKLWLKMETGHKSDLITGIDSLKAPLSEMIWQSVYEECLEGVIREFDGSCNKVISKLQTKGVESMIACNRPKQKTVDDWLTKDADDFEYCNFWYSNQCIGSSWWLPYSKRVFSMVAIIERIIKEWFIANANFNMDDFLLYIEWDSFLISLYIKVVDKKTNHAFRVVEWQDLKEIQDYVQEKYGDNKTQEAHSYKA